MKDLVSIVVPVYNVEKYLSECIESIQNQSYENLEIILVDDGSTDMSGRICERYKREDERIKVFHRRNSGVSATRNYGIAMSHGKYIMFVDSDDTIDKDTVKDNYFLAEKTRSELVIYCFRYIRKDINEIKDNGFDRSYLGKAQDVFKTCFEVLIDRELINPPWNKFIKKSLLDDNNIRFNEKYSICEDMAFSTEVLSASKIITLNGNIYYNYNLQQQGTLVFKFHNNYFEALTNFYDIALQYCRKFRDNKKQLEKLDTLYSGLVIMYLKQISCNSGWNLARKKKMIKSVVNNMKFKSALNNAAFNKKKSIVRKMINMHAYGAINLMYCFENAIVPRNS